MITPFEFFLYRAVVLHFACGNPLQPPLGRLLRIDWPTFLEHMCEMGCQGHPKVRVAQKKSQIGSGEGTKSMCPLSVSDDISKM